MAALPLITSFVVCGICCCASAVVETMAKAAMAVIETVRNLIVIFLLPLLTNSTCSLRRTPYVNI